jgi:PQ loop repeat protein
MAAAMMTITEIAGFVGAGLAGVAHVPQISRLMRARCSAGISQLAFGMWLLASLLTTARAVAIHAGVFIVLGVTQIVATALITLYATRYKDTPCPSPSASRVQRQDGHRNGHLGRTGKASRWTARLRVGKRRPEPDHRSPTAPSPVALMATCETDMVSGAETCSSVNALLLQVSPLRGYPK